MLLPGLLALMLLSVGLACLNSFFARRARAEFNKKLSAIGVKRWVELVPPMPPNEDNLFATAIAKDWLPVKDATNHVPVTQIPSLPPSRLLQNERILRND